MTVSSVVADVPFWSVTIGAPDCGALRYCTKYSAESVRCELSLKSCLMARKPWFSRKWNQSMPSPPRLYWLRIRMYEVLALRAPVDSNVACRVSNEPALRVSVLDGVLL